jgi:hypothetical protein
MIKRLTSSKYGTHAEIKLIAQEDVVDRIHAQNIVETIMSAVLTVLYKISL